MSSESRQSEATSHVSPAGVRYRSFPQGGTIIDHDPAWNETRRALIGDGGWSDGTVVLPRKRELSIAHACLDGTRGPLAKAAARSTYGSRDPDDLTDAQLRRARCKIREATRAGDRGEED